MKITAKIIIPLVLYIFGVFFFCEYLIYYIVIAQCGWPTLDPSKEDSTINLKPTSSSVKAMLLADTHLLGSRKGHWYDKLRREWQMYRSFQSAITLHKPDVVFVLGDLFDEGLWCGKDEFNYYVARFNNLFSVPEGTQLYVAAGNHDIGFHYGISPYLQERFVNAFNAPSVRVVSIRGNHFVLLNSMAMEGDGCFLCRQAEVQLQAIGDKLRCFRGGGKGCPASSQKQQYSRPILLQHFPLFRESDEHCNEPDEAPEMEKKLKFRERWECLSRESTVLLLDQLNPRAVLTGHTHHGCHTVHGSKKDIHEYTVPSFSWRNKENPTFSLAVFSANNYAVSKCHMPRENTVILLYAIGAAGFVFWILRTAHQLSSRRSRLFKSR